MSETKVYQWAIDPVGWWTPGKRALIVKLYAVPLQREEPEE